MARRQIHWPAQPYHREASKGGDTVEIANLLLRMLGAQSPCKEWTTQWTPKTANCEEQWCRRT